MTVLASGSKGNATVVGAGSTSLLVDAGLSCRELLRRMAAVGEDPERLDAILITHEHLDHVAGLTVLARRLKIPVFFTEQTHRAWTRMVMPRTTMSYAKWLDLMQREKEMRAVEAAEGRAPAHTLAKGQMVEESLCEPTSQGRDVGQPALCEPLSQRRDPSTGPGQAMGHPESLLVETQIPYGDDNQRDDAEGEVEAPKVKVDPSYLPAVEYFKAGQGFSIGEIEVSPFTIPHDAADPCGFVFHARKESVRMAIATDLGYVPPNVKMALKGVDVLLLESNHDLEMLKDGPYPWSVKQRVLSRVGHLSNAATAEFLMKDYDGGAHTIVLGHLSESNNLPELARLAAEQAIGGRMSLLGNRVVLASQDRPLEPICL
jgi:phosphoribosyl 1,2-cyclic phosphodiesterase